MKKLRIASLLMVCALLLCGVSSLSVLAGKTNTVSEPVLEEDVLNQTEWYFTDSNIVSKNQVLVIPGETSTVGTKFIAKEVSKADPAVKEMTTVDLAMRLTALPEGEQFILAFGLASIEASSKEIGNVEMVFTKDGGLKFGIVAYTENGAETILETRSCGISVNKTFSLDAKITSDAVLTVTINGKKLCEKKLPVSGEGRFGVLQTGGCGAEFSSLSYSLDIYETPENTNIFEDFETGDFNANKLFSTSYVGNVYPNGVFIEDYNGSKVLRFQNTGLAYIATKYKYSNFELSFDMPYFSRGVEYNEFGELVKMKCDSMGISWGSEASEPNSGTYVHDVDLIALRSDSVKSESRKLWSASLADLNVTDINTDEGYSVRLTMVDGHMTFQVKALNTTTYITVAEADYEYQTTGYIYIWSTGKANSAIDNLKITNLDNNANLIEVERVSSVMKAEDYVLTEEDTALVFRENVEDVETKQISDEKVFFIICGAGAVVLATAGIITGSLLKKKNKQRGEKV